MSRGLIWLAIWASIQLFFITSFSLLLVRVQQIYRIVRRQEKSCRSSLAEVRLIEASMAETAPRARGAAR